MQAIRRAFEQWTNRHSLVEDSTQYSTYFRVNNTTTHSQTENNHNGKQNKCTGYILNPGFLQTQLEQTVSQGTAVLTVRLMYVFVVSEGVLQWSFTFMFKKPMIGGNAGIQSCWLRSYGYTSLRYEMGHLKETLKSKAYMYTNVLHRQCKTLYM